MDDSSYKTLQFERDGNILTIKINGPGPLNAVNETLHHELARVFEDIAQDAASDLIILTGAGTGFCAGGDMDWFQEMIDDPSKFEAIGPDAKKIILSLIDLQKPILCRLNGPAAGLGASIALLCDTIIASDTASLGDPHVRMGLVAGDGGAVIWPQLIGFHRAKELLMTGDMLTADQARELGLITHVVAEEKLDEKVNAVAGKILRNPKWAVRWTKASVNLVLRDIAARVTDPSIAWEMQTNEMADHQEAVSAFREKRNPKFTGK